MEKDNSKFYVFKKDKLVETFSTIITSAKYPVVSKKDINNAIEDLSWNAAVHDIPEDYFTKLSYSVASYSNKEYFIKSVDLSNLIKKKESLPSDPNKLNEHILKFLFFHSILVSGTFSNIICCTYDAYNRGKERLIRIQGLFGIKSEIFNRSLLALREYIENTPHKSAYLQIVESLKWVLKYFPEIIEETTEEYIRDNIPSQQIDLRISHLLTLDSEIPENIKTILETHRPSYPHELVVPVGGIYKVVREETESLFELSDDKKKKSKKILNDDLKDFLTTTTNSEPSSTTISLNTSDDPFPF